MHQLVQIFLLDKLSLNRSLNRSSFTTNPNRLPNSFCILSPSADGLSALLFAVPVRVSTWHPSRPDHGLLEQLLTPVVSLRLSKYLFISASRRATLTCMTICSTSRWCTGCSDSVVSIRALITPRNARSHGNRKIEIERPAASPPKPHIRLQILVKLPLSTRSALSTTRNCNARNEYVLNPVKWATNNVWSRQKLL